MRWFDLTHPTIDHTPLLVEVPHAGLGLPEGLRAQLAVPSQSMWSDADIFVDKLVEAASATGASVLNCHVSRYAVDLNRSLHARDKHGVVWTHNGKHAPLWKEPLSAEEIAQRIETFYTPYHRALSDVLDSKRRRFGFALLLSVHSMPSTAIPNRADIVPGTRGKTSADPSLVAQVERFFRKRGFTLEHDRPYRGGHTTAVYGRPAEGIHAIQLEIKKSLYINEKTFEPLSPKFQRLSTVLQDLIKELAQLRLPSPSSGSFE